MIKIESPREILKRSEINNKIKEYFIKCANSRLYLRKCVLNAMDAGLTQENILKIINEMATRDGQDEASLCAIIAIGQALSYKKKPKKKSILTIDKEKNEIENKLRNCFVKCSFARKQLRKCVINTMNLGLTKEEILAILDDLVGGLGKNEVSACAIIAVDQVLRYQSDIRAKKIDIVKERELIRGDI